MLNDEICKVREELNKSIINNADYSVIYQISVRLDKLIAQHYRAQMRIENRNKKEIKKS